MSPAVKMRSEVDQLNAEIRDVVNAMPKDAQASLYEYLQRGLKRSNDVNRVVFGLALCMFSNVVTNIAELKELSE